MKNKVSVKNGRVRDEKPLSRSALRRQREREERYRTILGAAEVLFAREGYHQTSITQIADMAEVSVGTVYFYFKNKEDLLLHLLDDISYLLRSKIGAEFRKSEASLDGFMRAGQLFFDDFCRQYPEKLTILYRESVGQSPAVTERLKKHQQRFIDDVQAALLRVGQRMGLTFPGPQTPEVIAVSILGIYDCIVSHYLFAGHAPQALKQIGRDAVGFLIGGIRGLCQIP
jgi:AcrR family transcriptional regulator